MNKNLLKQKVDQLRQRPNANQKAIDAICDWLVDHNEIQRLRINPYHVAQYAEMDLHVIVPEMLHSVPIGLFDLHWEVHCPHCYMRTEEYDGLSQAKSASYCPMCAREFDVDFVRLVVVSFSLNPEIEYVEITPPCPPPPALKRYFPMGLPFLGNKSAEATLDAGQYRYCCPITLSKGLLTVEGKKTNQLQIFQVAQLPGPHFDPPVLAARPGPMRFEVKNIGHLYSGFFVIDDDLPMIESEQFPACLSGLDLIHYPTFWELFSDQVLSSRESINISSVSTLFTDITGSTQMYEKLGDAVAYNVVRDHFDILFKTIETHHGTVLKTIGDAVMASFTNNTQALKSVLDAQREFRQYNEDRHIDQRVHLKMGIHRGPAILVNLNNNLDYFGSTINKAARIQGQAKSNELAFSSEVYEDEAFQRVLEEAGITELKPEMVNLKGIAGQQTIYKVPIGG